MFIIQGILRGLQFLDDNGMLIAEIGNTVRYTEASCIELHPNEIIVGIKGKYKYLARNLVVAFELIVARFAYPII